MTHKNALFYWALVVSEMTGQIQSCVMFESTTLNVEMFRIIFNYSLYFLNLQLKSNLYLFHKLIASNKIDMNQIRKFIIRKHKVQWIILSRYI